jgi:hypothetical protein
VTASAPLIDDVEPQVTFQRTVGGIPAHTPDKRPTFRGSGSVPAALLALALALAERGPVAMLLLRRLCPRAIYPGPVPQSDPAALAEGIRSALPLMGTARADRRSWTRSAERYVAVLDRIDASCGRDDRSPGDRAGDSSLEGEAA